MSIDATAEDKEKAEKIIMDYDGPKYPAFGHEAAVISDMLLFKKEKIALALAAEREAAEKKWRPVAFYCRSCNKYTECELSLRQLHIIPGSSLEWKCDGCRQILVVNISQQTIPAVVGGGVE